MAGRSFTDPGALAAALDAAAARIQPAVASAVRHEGTLLRSLIQAHANGRPGPNVITGKYRASWRVVSERIAGGLSVTVGTNAPQGRRLEFGFVGPDSLGRVYNQPPFPHVQPSVDVLRPKFPEQIRKAVEEVL